MSTSASTPSPSENLHLNRKELRQPDPFMVRVRGFFDDLSKNRRALAIVAGLSGLVVAGGVAYQSKKVGQSEKGLSELYLARKEAERELTAVAAAQPVSVEKKEKGKPEAPSKPSAEAVAYLAFDVDAKLPETKKKFEAVTQKFPKTRAAFEARLALGDLYFNHGQAEKAVAWYRDAAQDAPNSTEKALALYSLGYAYESSAKLTEALGTFEKALGLGEPSIKGELLMAIARIQEANQQKDAAKKTYGRITQELPGTDYATQAALLQSELE